MKKEQGYGILLSILIAMAISLPIIGPIANNDLIVQDDFRQCCFWFWKWWDPELFQNDFFAPMYNSHIVRTPLLYLIYKIAPIFSKSLIAYTKILVIFIIILTAVFAFLFMQAFLEKYPSFNEKFGTFNSFGISFRVIDLVALIFSETLIVTTWCTDHITAAHSRSFVWFGLLAYMYFKLINKDLTANLFSLVLLFLSPHAFLVNFAMEFFSQLIKYKSKLIDFKRLDFLAWLGSALVTAFTYLVLFKDVQTQGVGTPFTVAEMKTLPEFNPGGRHPIFGSSIWDGSWWTNEHWGLGIGYLPISEIIKYGFYISIVYLLLIAYEKGRKQKKPAIFYTSFSKIFSSLPALLLYAGISLYFASQLLFPKLYLPSRYVAVPSLLLSVIVLLLVLVIWGYQISQELPKSISRNFLVALLIISGVFYWSHFKKFYHTRFVTITPQVNQVLETLPKDSLIASHPMLPDINVASITAKRKIYIDYERSMAYTKESLTEIRRRNEIALKMTYAPTKEEFLRLAQAEGITHFIAYYGFYSPQYKQMPVYLEPYNGLLRNLLSYQGKFFLEDYMEKSGQQYMIIEIKNLMN